MADAAAKGIGLQFGSPQGHFLVGAALASHGQFAEAVRLRQPHEGDRPLQDSLEPSPMVHYFDGISF